MVSETHTAQTQIHPPETVAGQHITPKHQQSRLPGTLRDSLQTLRESFEIARIPRSRLKVNGYPLKRRALSGITIRPVKRDHVRFFPFPQDLGRSVRIMGIQIH